MLEDAIKTQSGNSVSLLIDNTSASLLRDNTSLPSPARRLYGEDSIELVPSDSTGNVSPKGKRVLPERYLPKGTALRREHHSVTALRTSRLTLKMSAVYQHDTLLGAALKMAVNFVVIPRMF